MNQTAWRETRNEPSLSEVFRSVAVPAGRTPFRRFLAFIGPGYLVAVGYMDPGNWATSLAGGGQVRLCPVVCRPVVQHHGHPPAIALRPPRHRLGPRSGASLPRCLSALVLLPLWLFAEAAIIATDLAEVIGTAIGLNLLFGIALEIGIFITAADVFLILWLQNKGFRWIEAFVMALLAVIAACFVVQIAMADPVWGQVIAGFAPSTDILTNPDMLYIALGIIGATVMPHNLYLHSGIVQTRAFGADPAARRQALRLATWDSTIALMLALLVNSSILILAASTFHASGNTEIVEIDQAHALLSPLLGGAIAPTLFGIALLCCGMNATVTAAMAGQIVMEGFIRLRISPVMRRLVTRLLAIIPAVAVILIWGSEETGQLLILSQVVLSFQLPFAIVPLVMFTSSRAKMGDLVAPWWLTGLCALIAVTIILLNLNLLWSVATGGF